MSRSSRARREAWAQEQEDKEQAKLALPEMTLEDALAVVSYCERRGETDSLIYEKACEVVDLTALPLVMQDC